MCACIDLNGQTAAQPSSSLPLSDINCSKHLDTAHYCIIRADLTLGQQLAQSIHAAGESAPQGTIPGTIAIALHARDEKHLTEIAASLAEAGISHHIIEECDGEKMAIGCAPTTDRALMRKVLSRLPLAR